MYMCMYVYIHIMNRVERQRQRERERETERERESEHLGLERACNQGLMEPWVLGTLGLGARGPKILEIAGEETLEQ